MREYVDIRVTTEQIKKTLKDMIKQDNPHRNLIVDIIIDGLGETEIGLSLLYNSFSGVAPSVHVKVGDDVLVKYENLPTWRMNRDKMEEANQMEKGFVKCVVNEINLNRNESIIVNFQAYDDKNNITPTTYSMKPENVNLNNEEYPEGF